MNFFLRLNKKIILTLFIISITIIIITLLFKNNALQKVKDESEINLNNTKIEFDIIKPKFSINNNNQQISITANGGDFINKDEILLQNQVLFKSNRFELFSNNVLFNKKNQTAKSDENSLFISETTKITSEGFDIVNQGDIIKFYGKTSLITTK